MLAELGGASAYVGGTTGGAANAQTLSYLSPQGYALQPGAPIVCVAGFSNSAAATLNVLGAGAKSIFRNTVGGPVALVGGEIVAGSVCLFVYDGTRYELLNPASVTTGPLTATDGHLAVFDGTSGQILKDGGAPAGASIFTQSFTSADQTITIAGSLTLAHGLGAMPKLVQVHLKCLVDDLGFTAGDIVFVPMGEGYDGNLSRGFALVPDATNIFLRYGGASFVFALIRKNTGVAGNANLSSWALVVEAYA